MKISDMILILEEYKEKHGDIPLIIDHLDVDIDFDIIGREEDGTWINADSEDAVAIYLNIC